ncbi:hypothetical protein BH23ACI1_BH23ACI1_17890 [soil metagenome]
MMPMPPTNNEIPAIDARSQVITRDVSVAVCATSSCVCTVKSSSWSGPRRWRSRRRSTILARAMSIESRSKTCTLITMACVRPCRISR